MRKTHPRRIPCRVFTGLSVLLKSGQDIVLKDLLGPWMSKANPYSLVALTCAFTIIQGDLTESDELF